MFGPPVPKSSLNNRLSELAELQPLLGKISHLLCPGGPTPTLSLTVYTGQRTASATSTKYQSEVCGTPQLPTPKKWPSFVGASC